MGPILPVEIQPWYEKAACLDKDADCFFPEKGGSTRAAKRICQTCSVQTEDRKSTRLNSSHLTQSRMPSSA